MFIAGLAVFSIASLTCGVAQSPLMLNVSRGVQGVGPVGGGQHHDPAGVLEPVHLGEQLVEGLLPLVAAGVAGVVAAGAEGVDLVDEHDRRAAGAGLLEQVPDPGRPDADEQLHEARA